jgi:transcriptional regulator GlxA family with amidase domain
VAKGLRYVWEHSHEPIGVQDLVTATAMSRRGLHKAFVKYLGRGPGQELRRVRLERAQRLLAESGQKIEAVAGQCGYQSANSFCVAFRTVIGMSPKAYRDQLPHRQ